MLWKIWVGGKGNMYVDLNKVQRSWRRNREYCSLHSKFHCTYEYEAIQSTTLWFSSDQIYSIPYLKTEREFLLSFLSANVILLNEYYCPFLAKYTEPNIVYRRILIIIGCVCSHNFTIDGFPTKKVTLLILLIHIILNFTTADYPHSMSTY